MFVRDGVCCFVVEVGYEKDLAVGVDCEEFGVDLVGDLTCRGVAVSKNVGNVAFEAGCKVLWKLFAVKSFQEIYVLGS